MNKKVIAVVMLVVALLVTGAVAVGAPSGGTTTSTVFALQNMGSLTANAVVDYHNMNGTIKYTASGITIPVGSSVIFDQRTDASLGTSFQGNVVASADQQLGSVVRVIKKDADGAGAAVNAYESYNGFDSSVTGQAFILPQIVKAVSSGGLIYDSDITIQNADASSAANITITFTPAPGCGATCGLSYVKTVSIPAAGSYNLDQLTQPAAQIGTRFYGSAKVTADKNVAIQALGTGRLSGKDKQLLAYPTYAGGTTAPISLLSVYKFVSSLGDTYSTAFLISNFGATTATVVITYTANGIGSVSGTDSYQIGPGAVLPVDQRSQAPSITTGTFFGSAVVRSAGSEPIAVAVNLRGGSKYVMAYDGLSSGATNVYLPLNFKFLTADGGYQFSSAALIHNFGATPAHVQIWYYDSRAGKSPVVNATQYVIADTLSVDLRSHASAASFANFQGAMVIHSMDNPIGAMVQTRGAGGPGGDALEAYKGYSQ